MIRNGRHYSNTKEWIGKFEQSIADLRRTPGPGDALEPQMRGIVIRAQESILEDLRTEAAEYEALRNGQVRRLKLDSLRQLPAGLIKARIAAGLTQRQLAERLGLKEQQIQRYEATDYRSASLGRICEVADALGVKVREEMSLPRRVAVAGRR